MRLYSISLVRHKDLLRSNSHNEDNSPHAAKEDGLAQVTREGIAFLPLPFRSPEVADALSHKGLVRKKALELKDTSNE